MNAKRNSVQRQENKIKVTQSYSGAIPMSSEFEKYEAILPGVADRLVTMAELDQKSTLLRLQKSQTHEIILKYLGMIFAFLIVMVFCGLIYLAIQKDMEWTASIISIGGIATLISKFIIK